MRKSLFLLYILFFSGLATAESNSVPQAPGLTSIESEPSGIVDGCVNVISGQFFDCEVDLVIPGPQALKVERLLQYNNPSALAETHDPSWTYNHVSSLAYKIQPGGDTNYKAYFSKGLENPSTFSIKKNKKKLTVTGSLDPGQFLEGVTNSSKGAIGAQTNPKNRELTWLYEFKRNYLQMEDGSTLVFQGTYGGPLFKEIFPSGLYLLHERNKKDQLERVVLKNSKKQELADYKIERFKKNPLQKIIACDGRTVSYHIEEKRNKRGDYLKLTEVNRPNSPLVTYSYYPEYSYFGAPPSHLYPNGGYDDNEKLRCKSFPDNRYKEVIYYTKGMTPPQGHHVDTSPDQPHFRRISHLLAPVGSNASPEVKFRFHYHLPSGPNGAGTTGVYDALGHKTDYDFNHRQRLTSIRKFFANGSQYTQESLEWGPQDSHLGMQLRMRAFKVINDPYDLFARQYTYDDRGNIIQDLICGNICGIFPSTLRVQGETLSGNYDTLQKTYCYSKDSYNLLTEATVGSLKKTFQYLPKSNLLTSCFHYSEEGIFLRHFYTYDENAMIIEHIVDDGSGFSVEDLTHVTERKIERIQRTSKYPVGLPIDVKEYYLDVQTGKEHLFLKKINKHDALGRLIRQETYGSDGEFAYAESWAFDDHGNLCSEINRLGQEIVRDFDANDNMIYQRGIDTRFEQVFTYDYMNRLRQIDEIHPDGKLSKYYQYDLCGNPTATIDALGNETNTEYDEFSRPVRVIGAPLVDSHGALYRPVTTYQYDALSNPIKITSPEGHFTEFAYTLGGKPYFIHYPDGTKEFFEYDIEGRLVKEVAKNGVETKYTYDVQGRNTKKEVFSNKGLFLFKTEARYNTFHLIEEVDAAGTVTFHSYDFLGRKSSEVKGDIITTFEYDTLSRVIKRTVRSLKDPKETTATCARFDLLDRIIEERIESSEGKVLTLSLFTYDAAGNKSKIEQIGDAGTSFTLMVYDSHGIPVKITDPEKNISLNRLILDHYNAWGQRVFAIERTDSKGTISLSIQDTHGRVVEVLKKNSFGNLLQKTTYQKDSSGRCTATIATVYLVHQPTRIVKNLFEYDAAGRHIATIQAAGTPEEKRSSVQYNALGQKIFSVKPSGEVLTYQYDAMGRLKEYFGHDIHYRYIYDICSNPIVVENLIDGNATACTYDVHHRKIKESLANSLSSQMTYTPEGYLKSLILPDASSVHYTYEGPLLKQVDRYQNQEVAYTHQYLTHDLGGRLLKSSLIHNLGTLTHQFNRKGKISQMASSFYQENMEYDALGNLIKRTMSDPLGTQEEQLTYDLLNQLSCETGIHDHTYAHDSLYNRRIKDGKMHTHNALNQLLSDGDTEFSYDMNGNLVKELRKGSMRTFTYDALDRLKTLHIDKEHWEFFYDEQNRCILYKASSDNTSIIEKVLYIGQNDIGTADAVGRIHTLRILGKGLGAEIGAAIALEIDGKTFAPLHDHRGNVVSLIDTAGKAAETYRYTSFGEEQIFDDSGMLSPHSHLENPWRFSSKRHFGDYLLFGRRFYDPNQGRWLSPDPIGYSAGPNLYAYVSNNPQTHLDLYGLSESSSPGFFDRVSDFFDRACDFVSGAWGSFRDCFSRGYDVIREGVRGIFDAVRERTSFLGSGVKFISTNVIVLPVFRDFFASLGHAWENGTLEGYQWSWLKEKSKFIHGKGEYLCSKVRVILCNGVNVTGKEFLRALEHVREIFGFRADGAYNSTDCLTVDLVETALQKIGIPSDSVDVLVQCIRESIQVVGGVGSDGLVVTIDHSQGGQILFNALQQLSEEERRMVVVCTLGSAKIIVRDGLRYCVNYISDHDFITRAGDPEHYKQAKQGLLQEVKFVKSLEPGFLDHSFTGLTYTDALKDFAEYFYRELWHP